MTSSTPPTDLFHHADRSPDRVACVDGTLTVSYGTLAKVVGELARSLRSAGVHPGDRVCLLLDNSARFVATYLAALNIGATVVPLNPSGNLAGVADMVIDAQPRTIVCEPRLGSKVAALLWPDAIPTEIPVAELGGALAVVPMGSDGLNAADVPANPLATIIYTSGTTGAPKGVMLSADNMAAIAEAGSGFVDLDADDRLGIVTPLFHLYALREIDAALHVGAACLLPTGLAFPAGVLRQLHDETVTGISGVPSGLLLLTEGYGVQLSDLAPHLRYLALGTAETSPALLQALTAALPETRLIVTYGLTELSRACHRDVPFPDDRPRSVGRPYPGVALEIRDDEGCPVGPNVPGRVVLRSRMVMQGYWRRPSLTAQTVLSDGTLITPDIGTVDEQGYLFLMGRGDDIINCGGEKIGPQEIERVLSQHPAILDAAVVGVPDPAGLLGQVVKAWLVARPGDVLDAESVRRHCAAHLEPYKVPRQVEFRARLPKTILGKTDRAALSQEG